jgi:TolB protein
MNVDGSGITTLAGTGGTNEGKHSWTPDGAKIAVSREVGGRPAGEIYLVNVDGSGSDRIWLDGDAFDPAISPDGSKLAFRTRRDNSQSEIYVANINGTEITRLTFIGGAYWPDWSPDGTEIAFVRYPSSGSGGMFRDLYVMDSDGSNRTLLATYEQSSNGEVAWSPDGTKLIYSCASQLCVINRDGTGQHTLSVNATAGFPDWTSN